MRATQSLHVRSRRKYALFLALIAALLFSVVLRASQGHGDPTLSEDSALAVAARKSAFHGPVLAQGESQNELESPHMSELQPSKDLIKEYGHDEKDQHESDAQAAFRAEHQRLGNVTEAGTIYGNTLATLSMQVNRDSRFNKSLRHIDNHISYSAQTTLAEYHPYAPDHGKVWSSWFTSKMRKHVPCDGPFDSELANVSVFLGRPKNFPEPAFGGYDVLELDGNLCFERDTRLGPYGNLSLHRMSNEDAAEWDDVNWGHLQQECITRNQDRFDLIGRPNPYLDTYQDMKKSHVQVGRPLYIGPTQGGERSSLLPQPSTNKMGNLPFRDRFSTRSEDRTAILLRSFTGYDFTENDKQVIRALVTELALHTGGVYQVYILLQVKDSRLAIWDDEEVYQAVLEYNVPPEFHGMTVLWDDRSVQSMYPNLDPSTLTVHAAQWLSVQKFAQEHPEFTHVWNWEMDTRVIGHHYELLEKLVAFAKRQPRRGLWERNERYYIPSVHGDYDKEFRRSVEAINGPKTIWAAPKLPFIRPVGPNPPVAEPKNDNYRWGVGEEADLITVAPIFDPVNSSWVLSDDIWGFNASSFPSTDLPRRATIGTHSRVSKRLLDIMHIENLRGNLVASEMMTQTVALLHGLKAVYAPTPVWFDRPWKGPSLSRWFNGGPKGASGKAGSAFGWGREGRFGGSTWYYRATPPQRLYSNWMGWEDTGMGGPSWEATHGRACLPPMILHPVKDTKPTSPGHSSESRLPYD